MWLFIPFFIAYHKNVCCRNTPMAEMKATVLSIKILSCLGTLSSLHLRCPCCILRLSWITSEWRLLPVPLRSFNSLTFQLKAINSLSFVILIAGLHSLTLFQIVFLFLNLITTNNIIHLNQQTSDLLSTQMTAAYLPYPLFWPADVSIICFWKTPSLRLTPQLHNHIREPRIYITLVGFKPPSGVWL